MQEAKSPDFQSTDDVSEMPASSVLINSPQFNRVLEQMGDFREKIHKGMKKKTATMSKSMPLIEVTCFDDEVYNKKIQLQLENAPASEANEASLIGNSAAQQNNESEMSSGNSSNDEDAHESNATSSGERNSWVENNTDGVLSKKNTSRKCSKGFVVSSPQSPNRMTTQTKENNYTETKRLATDPEELKSSEPKTPRKPDSRHSDVLASPSAQRRRYTVGSFSSDNGSSNEPQNNSELNNRRTSVGVAQNCPRSPKPGDRKLSSEILNGRKKPERINLSFKVDSLENGLQPKQFRKRSRTYEGQTQNPRKATSSVKRSSSEEHFLSDGDFRMHHDNRRLADGNPSPSVGKSPRETFQTKESNESLGINESSLSLLKDSGLVSSIDNPSLSTGRGSSSTFQGVKSVSKGVSEKQPLSHVDVTQRLNLSPPRRRRVDTPGPPQDDKQAHLGVSTSPTRRKSETDLRKFASEEEEVEDRRQVCLSTPPRVRRGSYSKPGEMKTSLGVSNKASLSRSETDLRKLVSEEEHADTRRPSLSSPQRVSKLSSSKPLITPETFSSASGPVSPQIERKIYLAAAKPAPRLPIRAKVRNDLAVSSQIIIDQAEKELDKFSQRLPHISMEEVMKSWQTDSRHWNVVSSLVKPNSDCASKANMEAVKNCRYIRDGVLRKKKHSH